MASGKFGTRDREPLATVQNTIGTASRAASLSESTTSSAMIAHVLPPQILRALERARIVLADLTGDRPNCYFEAGYVLGLRKEIILTCRHGDQLHLEVGERKIIYGETKRDLKRHLLNRLKAIRGPASAEH